MRFPFGHGLSYTSFLYSWAAPPLARLAAAGRGSAALAATLSVTLNNTGAVPGAEVVQLYLSFPQGAGEQPGP